MNIFVLILCASLLHFFAGGLVPEALYSACLILNLTACLELYKQIKAGRIFDPIIILGTLLLYLLAQAFFIADLNVISSAESRLATESIHYLIDQLQHLGLIEAQKMQTYLGQSYWLGIHTYLILLTLPASLFLTASLTHKEKIILIYSLICLASFNIIAVYLSTNFVNFGGKVWGLFDIGIKKPLGGFGLSNHYGVYLCFFLPFITIQIMNFIQKKKFPLIIGHCALLIFFIYGTLISGSRGAFLICAIAFTASLLLYKNKKIDTKSIKYTLVSFFIILFAALTPSAIDRELNKRGIESETRLKLYMKAPEILLDYPQGLGPGAYYHTAASYITKEHHSNTMANHSENTYLQIILEYGIGFSIILVILVLFLTKVAVRNYNNTSSSSRIKVASLVAVICFLIHGLYDNPIEVPVYSYTIVIFFGLLLCKAPKYQIGIDNPNKKYFSLTAFILPILAIFSTLDFYKKFDNSYRFKHMYSYHQKANLNELILNLQYQAHSWHNWYFLSRSLRQFNSKETNLLVEYCLKQAAFNHPNQSDLWLRLAWARKQNNDLEPASKSYRRYFLLTRQNQRKKIKNEALNFMSEEEYERLLHMELPMQERTREYIRSI